MADGDNTYRRVGRFVVGLIFLATLASCTEADSESDQDAASTSTSTPTSTSTSTPTSTSTSTSTEQVESVQGANPTTTVADGDQATAETAPPASRADENPVTNGVDHWIGRGTMTASTIELVWSPVEGALSYRIHRFERIGGFDPLTAPLTEDSLVYESDSAITTTDDQLIEGTFYTYVLEVEVGDGSLERRWTEGLARDDTTPPAPISNLRAEVTPAGVLLSWDQSSDDVEFASYSVSLVEDDQPRYIGGGGDVEQSSFLDTRPPTGLVTYSIQAVDFHDNRTEPVTIEVANG